MISLAVLAAAVIVIVSALTALRARDTLRVDQPVYTYIGKGRIEWPEGVRLIRRKGVTYIKSGGEKRDLQFCPLVTGDGASIIMQKSCSYNRTADDQFFRTDYFTSVSRDGEELVLRRKGTEVRGLSGFLYDNDDTYVFLESGVLELGGEEIRITPMTVVQADYLSSILIFGPGREPFFERLDQDNLMVRLASGRSVDVATDRYYEENGTWRLLFLSLDALPDMKAGVAGDEEN